MVDADCRPGQIDPAHFYLTVTFCSFYFTSQFNLANANAKGTFSVSIVSYFCVTVLGKKSSITMRCCTAWNQISGVINIDGSVYLNSSDFVKPRCKQVPYLFFYCICDKVAAPEKFNKCHQTNQHWQNIYLPKEVKMKIRTCPSQSVTDTAENKSLHFVMYVMAAMSCT